MATGRSLVIIASDRPNGDCPAQDYIDKLQEEEQIPILALIGRLANHGPLVNPQKFKKLHGHEIYELKSNQHRIFAFFGRPHEDGRPTLVLANAYCKKANRTTPQVIDKAQRLQDGYFQGGAT